MNSFLNFLGVIAFIVFLFVSIYQFLTFQKWRRIIGKFKENSNQLTMLIERETAVVSAKEAEIQSLQEIIKNLDAEIAFNKCKKDGV